jgi:hypothetical protein
MLTNVFVVTFFANNAGNFIIPLILNYLVLIEEEIWILAKYVIT